MHYILWMLSWDALTTKYHRHYHQNHFNPPLQQKQQQQNHNQQQQQFTFLADPEGDDELQWRLADCRWSFTSLNDSFKIV